MKKKTKICLSVLIVVMACLLGILLLAEAAGQRQRSAEYARKEEELRPIRQEEARLEEELEDLEEEYKLNTSGNGTVTVLFTDLDERIYTEIYPQMKEYGFTGLFAVSPEYLPDGEGRMTSAQAAELLGAGWECCPTWRAGDSIQAIQDQGEILAALGAAPAGTVYFEEGAYSQIYDGDLAAAGYTAAVHHGEEDLPLVTSDASGQVWHPGAVGLKGKEPRFRLEDAAEQGANIIFTVSFIREDEMYDARAFGSLLDYLERYSSGAEIAVTFPEKAGEYYYGLSLSAGTYTEEYEQKRGELEKKLQELRQEEIESERSQ